MSRKTGKQTKIEIELGTEFYPMSLLSTVSSPVSDVGKKYLTNAEYISDQENLQPVIRLDGVLSGFTITASTNDNEVDISAGTAYVQGLEVSVAATSVDSLLRPTTSGNIRINAITVNSTGTYTVTAGVEGTPGGDRGAAGGMPFYPVNEVLVGLITMSYYDGSESGADVVDSDEINSEVKERADIPSVQIIYHDGSGSDPQEIGVIKFASALPLIHAATATGPGTARRNVYAQYHDAIFEEMPDCYDWNFSAATEAIVSRAYQDEGEEKAIGIKSWSNSGNAYYTKFDDVWSTLDGTKRWFRQYSDVDGTDFTTGRGIISVSRNAPVGDTLNAAISFEGSGELYVKS